MLKRPFEPSSATASEAVELQQVAYEFSQEVQHRQAFEAYCQWYYATAEQHRAEQAAMENDIPLFSWFWRRRA